MLSLRSGSSVIALCIVIWSLSLFNWSSIRPSVFYLFKSLRNCPEVSRVPTHREEVIRATLDDLSSPAIQAFPSLTIFSAPTTFVNSSNGGRLFSAVRSWLRLNPPPAVVLLSTDPSCAIFASSFGRSDVSCDSSIDSHFLGSAFFHSVLSRATAVETELSMLISPNLVVSNDLVPAIVKVNSYFDHWILTASPWLVDGESSEVESESEFKDRVQNRGKLMPGRGNEDDWVGFWIWNNSPVPLVEDVVPPFTMGSWETATWFMGEIVGAGLRQVVDASLSIVSGNPWGREERKTQGKKWTKWLRSVNQQLARSHGRYEKQYKELSQLSPWTIVRCLEPSAGNLCLLKKIRTVSCPCEYSPFVLASHTDSYSIANGLRTCGSTKSPSPQIPPKSPHTLPHILSLRGKLPPLQGLRVVTLVTWGLSSGDHFLDFVCRLKKLEVDHNLIIAAKDLELYQMGISLGLPVFYWPKKEGKDKEEMRERKENQEDLEIVLDVLERGYSVLYSSTNLIWFQDPLPVLVKYGKGSFPLAFPSMGEKGGKKGELPGLFLARAEGGTLGVLRGSRGEVGGISGVLCGGRLEENKGGKCGEKLGVKGVLLSDELFTEDRKWENEEEVGGKGEIVVLRGTLGENGVKLGEGEFKHFDRERKICIQKWHSQLGPILWREN